MVGAHSRQPLNPVLGEFFQGEWPEKNGRGLQTLISEQGASKRERR